MRAASDFRLYPSHQSGLTLAAMGDALLVELSSEECLARLRATQVGRIAVIVDEFPIILPVNYRLIEAGGVTWVAVRTRPGNVIDRASMRAAFEIDGVDTVRHEGWSVVVRGTLMHVDPDAGDLRERFDPEPWLLAERDAWLVIEPFSITGRRLQSAQLEWSFHAAAYR
jgi:nitroimidazol reductase NimA-like FMN-containing flavoprotein (pyridoxamine 5'-phosphate oxidase superfamily)